MTSGNFSLIPVSSIHIDREARQRRELTGIDELAQSIVERGLINPIVVTRDHILVAGERRLTAHKKLGFDQIAVQYTDEIDGEALHLIELEENIKREALTWQDHVRAVEKFHTIRNASEPDWTQSRTAEALNMDAALVSKYLTVTKAMDEGVAEVIEAPKLSTAINFSERRKERQKATAKRDLMTMTPVGDGTPPDATDAPHTPAHAPGPSRFADVQNVNFAKWSKSVLDEPYNLIHCDFPYGVSAGDKSGQSGAAALGKYSDRPEDYFNLLNMLIERQDNFIAPSAHLVFWFSMDYYEETRIKLHSAGWRVSPFPLIWHKSDNTGILPDPNRGPRRTYETALFCTRGDRKVVRAVANSVGAATTKHYHTSEKAEVMLTHFFRMLVDDSTRMLDPTCGSGMAVKVAESLGAGYSLGLEMDEEFAARARENLKLD